MLLNLVKLSLCLLTLGWSFTHVNGARTRIVGGLVVEDRTYFYYQVSMRYDKDHICGGSMIHENFVLTAAHCVFYSNQQPLNSQQVTVVGGDLNIAKSDEHTATSQVIKIIPHPSYNPKTQENDIAILQLATPLPVNDFIKPIPLSADTPVADSGCLVSGWGHTSEGGNRSDVLRFVAVPIIDRISCNESYQGMIKDGMICAGYAEGGKDACQYDSGGPLVCDNVLYGVVSYGFGCARSGFPGVYTNVATYKKSFIDPIISPSEPRSEDPIDDCAVVQLLVNGRTICTGVIIDKNIVLTASRCTRDDIPNILLNNQITYEPSHVFGRDEPYGLAVIRAQRPFDLSANCKVLERRSSGAKAADGKCATIHWGQSNNSPTRTLLVQSSDVKRISEGICLSNFDGLTADGIICVEETTNNACTGEPGGALICDGKLEGIMTSNAKCSGSKGFAAYARVANHEQWIDERRKRVDVSMASQMTFASISMCLTLLLTFCVHIML